MENLILFDVFGTVIDVWVREKIFLFSRGDRRWIIETTKETVVVNKPKNRGLYMTKKARVKGALVKITDEGFVIKASEITFENEKKEKE